MSIGLVLKSEKIMTPEPEQFFQPIICKRCKALLGYAPYWRDNYLCVKCNGPLPDDDEAAA